MQGRVSAGPGPAPLPAVVALRLVPGTTAVAFLLATGRWGSYLGWPGSSVYLTDVLLVGGTALALLRRPRIVAPVRTTLAAVLPVVALAVWAVVRTGVGLRLDGDVVRDGAPYGYVLVALLAVVSVDGAAGRRTFSLLRGALLFHAAWVTLSFYVPRLAHHLPSLGGGAVRILDIRPDYDGALLGALSVLALHEAIRATRWHNRLLWLGAALWPVYLLLQLQTRAVVIGLVAAGLILAAANARNVVTASRRATLAWCLALLALALVVVPRTTTYHRIVGTGQFSHNVAAGTAHARFEAWTDVVHYVDRVPARVLAGVGFGPDFLHASGAAVLFEGTTYTHVRAPHDYLVNTYARLGLIGLGLLLWLLAAWVAAVVRRFFIGGDFTRDELLCAVVATTLLVTSLFGVVLESPFGAVPFYWCVGILLVASGRGRVGGAARAAQPGPAEVLADSSAAG